MTGGYKIIDLYGIDLINEETLNNSVYEQIEKANKNKPLCIVNIVKDKIEYQAQFINVNIDNIMEYKKYKMKHSPWN